VFGHDFQPPLTETKADAAGRFTISFTTEPFGDLKRLDKKWQEFWKKTAIAASLKGYGPAWVEYKDVEGKQQSITLKLVEDVPLRGRVVDLDGGPFAATSVQISEQQAAEDEDLSAWLAGIKAGELCNTVWQKAPRSV